MRNKLLILISLPIFFQLGISCCSASEYKIENGKIFWKQDLKVKKELKNVDLETFEDLDGSVKLNAHFAKDKNNIYYQGKVIKELDSKIFEVVKRNIPTKGDPRGDCVNYIKIFKDKNGIYQLEDIQKGVLELID